MKIGILREEKVPADMRVALTPTQCLHVKKQYPGIDLVVRPSKIRKFLDAEYLNYGIDLQEDLYDCDILIGIKEVPVKDLIPNKTYLYFSHTIKEQTYNRELLKKMLELNITMIDYEVLTNNSGKRIIGFGRYAGIVGCYNAFLAYGKRTKSYNLKPAHLCYDRNELELELQNIRLPSIKIVITGKGRVGKGVMELIRLIGVKEVSVESFLKNDFNEAVFVNIDCLDYYVRIDGKVSSKADFFKNPTEYRSDFMKFAKVSDVFIAGHFYDPKAPYLFTRDDAKLSQFKIRTVADISCDIDGPVACTIQASSIHEPIYGYNPNTESLDNYNKKDNITVMAVDNLPCELPKDASFDFGQELIKEVLPILLNSTKSKIIERAIICENGKLKEKYAYLNKYVNS